MSAYAWGVLAANVTIFLLFFVPTVIFLRKTFRSEKAARKPVYGVLALIFAALSAFVFGNALFNPPGRLAIVDGCVDGFSESTVSIGLNPSEVRPFCKCLASGMTPQLKAEFDAAFNDPTKLSPAAIEEFTAIGQMCLQKISN